MRFFVVVFIFIYACFAADPEDRDLTGGGDSPQLARVPSFSCHRALADIVKESIIGSKSRLTIVLDFDKVLGEEVGGQTVPTLLAKQLDRMIGEPDVRANIYGILILTARDCRRFDVRSPKTIYPEEETTLRRKETILTTNTELTRCVPNIAAFLRSKDNFGGMLPDFLEHCMEEQYRTGGYTVHSEGFIYSCGLFVMGGAISSSSKRLRHCKHFTLREALKLLPKPDGGHGVLYIDDHKPWFAPFVEQGLGDGISMHLFHYDVAFAPVAVRPKSTVQRYRKGRHGDAQEQRHIVRAHQYDTYEDDSLPSIKTIFKTALRCAATAAVVYCVLRPIDSIRNLRIVKLCERVFFWALHLTFNCMKKVAFKILFDK